MVPLIRRYLNSINPPYKSGKDIINLILTFVVLFFLAYFFIWKGSLVPLSQAQTPGVTLTAEPTIVHTGEYVRVSWSGLEILNTPTPTPDGWINRAGSYSIAMYRVGDPVDKYTLFHGYLNCGTFLPPDPTPMSGFCDVQMTITEVGMYNFRLFAVPQWAQGFDRQPIAISNPFTLAAPVTGTPIPTLTPPPGSSPFPTPIISFGFLTPQSGDVSGTIDIAMSVPEFFGGAQTTRVELYIQHRTKIGGEYVVTLYETFPAAPYIATLDTTIAPYVWASQLQLWAYDSAGNIHKSFLTINVKDITPPHLVITYPLDGATITRKSLKTNPVTLEIWDVANYTSTFSVKVNGKYMCYNPPTFQNQTTYTCLWWSRMRAGEYTIEATVFDSVGNQATDIHTITIR